MTRFYMKCKTGLKWINVNFQTLFARVNTSYLTVQICPIKFQTRKQVITPTLRADLYTKLT